MSKNKKSWGFIKKEYRGCFENVYFQDILFECLKKTQYCRYQQFRFVVSNHPESQL